MSLGLEELQELVNNDFHLLELSRPEEIKATLALQQIIDELRTGKAGSADAPSDLPEHCAPFLRTVLDVVCAGQTPTAAELLRLKDVTVELVDLDSDAVVTYTIVGDLESDIKQQRISVSSPIARAMIGKHEGDAISIQAPGGSREYEITAVRYLD